jgi:hypothetical protein
LEKVLVGKFHESGKGVDFEFSFPNLREHELNRNTKDLLRGSIGSPGGALFLRENFMPVAL